MGTLCASHLAFSYGKNQLLNDISFEINPGTFTAILGPNGSGKSTVMSLLTGMRTPQSGCVLLDDTPINKVPRNSRAKQIAFVSQHSHGNRLAVFDAILLGRRPYMEGAPTESDMLAVEQVIEELEIEHLALRHLDELSGGEYQIVMLARAFVQATPLLLLDEPTNNLDLSHQHAVLQLVRTRVEQQRIGAVAVLHDVNLALRYCSHFVFIKDGYVPACGGSDVITSEHIQQVYGVAVDIICHNGITVAIPQ